MCNLVQKSAPLKTSLIMVAFLMGLTQPVIGQTSNNSIVGDRFATVSIEAQRLIRQSSQIESDRAKDIALKRPIRKMVGQYGYILDFKSPRKRPSSARKIIIRQPRTYMSGIP